mgnify:CR=1 FL=1
MVIDVRDLEFRWQPDAPAVLSIASFQVTPGECLFIKGPSGSGKSTLLSLLSGVTTAVTGTVRVMGQELERLGSVQRDHFRADHIGYIFQMFNLIPYLSVVDNVMLPCRFSSLRKDRAVDANRTVADAAARLLGSLGLGPG